MKNPSLISVATWPMVLTRDGKRQSYGWKRRCPADPRSNCSQRQVHWFRVVRVQRRRRRRSPNSAAMALEATDILLVWDEDRSKSATTPSVINRKPPLQKRPLQRQDNGKTMSEFAQTERTQVKRLPKRGHYDRETVQ